MFRRAEDGADPHDRASNTFRPVLRYSSDRGPAPLPAALPPKGERPGAGARTTDFTGITFDLGSAPKGTIPRKEVIQPQLPLRLPCYDFVPITHPALDGCLPEGLAHRLQALPAFMT